MRFIYLKEFFGERIDLNLLEKQVEDISYQHGGAELSGEALLALVIVQLLERIEKLENVCSVKNKQK